MGSNNASRTNILVPISDNGARLIFNQVRRIRATGGTRPIYAIDLAKSITMAEQGLGKFLIMVKHVLKIISFL